MRSQTASCLSKVPDGDPCSMARAGPAQSAKHLPCYLALVSVPPGKGDAAGTRLPLCSLRHPCGKGLSYQVLIAWGYWAARHSVEESLAVPVPACSSWLQCGGRCVPSLGINVAVRGHSTAGSETSLTVTVPLHSSFMPPREAVPSLLAQPVPPKSPITLSPLPWAALPSVREHAKPKPGQIKT